MSAKVRPRVGQRQFKVRVERSDDASYTAKIAAVDDAPAVVAANGLNSGILDLVNDILIEIAREGEESPDGHH
jgi:hypothetical protein